MPSFVLMPHTPDEWVMNIKAIGSVILWIAAIIGGLAVIARVSLETVPGGRQLWKLYRYLFADPLHRRRVANLAAAMKDALDAVESRVLTELAELRTENTAEHRESWHRLDTLEARTAVIETKVDVHATLIDRGADRLDQMIAQNGNVIAALTSLREEVAALRTTQLATTKETHHAQ